MGGSMLEPPRMRDAALLRRVTAHFEESARLQLSALQPMAPSMFTPATSSTAGCQFLTLRWAS